MIDSRDCAVVGGGAAGLSAALVLARARCHTFVVDAGEQSNRVVEVMGGHLGYGRRPPDCRPRGSLGKLLAEAAARSEAAVEGPRWDIAPENPAYDESRRRAMADARRRAESYAEAAGLLLGPVMEVVEGGAEHLGRATGSWVLTGGVGYSAAAEMPAHTEGLRVVAEVHVTYGLRAG